MAGIYIHIPFCRTRCVYCGFFSTTSLSKIDAYVDALCKELSERRNYLRGEDVSTIYFGGGTPSQLSIGQIKRILDSIYNINNVRANAELSFEGNPDDLTLPYLHDLHDLGINRLSMGVQSFDDSRLQFLHRRHSSAQAKEAVLNAVDAGFRNISIDLMFGFPLQTVEQWRRDVEMAMSLPIQHLSAYSLMYDDGTPLSAMLERGDIEELDEEVSLQMYKVLVESLTSGGFEHYEISNFCKPGYRSRHNSSYWSGVPYLGVGAGAHSYDGSTRQYNVESLAEYMASSPQIAESLSKWERYNEFVFTGLRTVEGISLSKLRTEFGNAAYDYCMKNAQKHIDNGMLMFGTPDLDDESLRLSPSGVFVSNDIMSDLMYVD